MSTDCNTHACVPNQIVLESDSAGGGSQDEHDLAVQKVQLQHDDDDCPLLISSSEQGTDTDDDEKHKPGDGTTGCRQSNTAQHSEVGPLFMLVDYNAHVCVSNQVELEWDEDNGIRVILAGDLHHPFYFGHEVEHSEVGPLSKCWLTQCPCVHAQPD